MKNRLLIVMLCGLLCGCGVKPDAVESPAEGKDLFPRTYPDPATDPRPERQGGR